MRRTRPPKQQRTKKPKKPSADATRVTKPAPLAKPAPHIGRPIRGCACMQCGVHRMLQRQEERDRRLQRLYEDAPMTARPRLGATATESLIRALT